MREKKFDAARLEALVDQRSGLLGIQGSVATRGVCTKPLHRAAMHTGHRDVLLSVRKLVAAMIAVLGGLDMLVFTGGIGENDASVRTEICADLS